jgi:acyl carrier protein
MSAPKDRLYQAISGVLGVALGEIQTDTSPESVPSWDSLNHLNLVMALETEFEIALTPEQVFEMRNVEMMQRILREHGVDV